MSRFQCPGVEEIIAVMKAKAYAVFDGGPSHNLNIIGIRSDDNEANSFNDWLTVSYFFDGVWNSFVFPATTDPGTHWRREPMNVRGTAIMKPGQYRGAYMLGNPFELFQALVYVFVVQSIFLLWAGTLRRFICIPHQNGRWHLLQIPGLCPVTPRMLF